MRRCMLWFECVGHAVCANGLKALLGAVPFGDGIYDIAKDALDRLRQRRQEEELRAALEDAARAAIHEVQEAAVAVVRTVASDQPEEIRNQLTLYLMQLPAAIRQTLKRPADPGGLSIPISLRLRTPEDLLPFLPTRLPRYRTGDRPAGIGDWELVDLLGVGGFGEVWKARHLHFDGIAPVALKFCLDPAAKDRLLRHEAHVLNQVMRQGRHPGIVPLLDASLGLDPPCLRYEYIAGGDLAGLVRDWQELPAAERCARANRVLLPLAEVVGYAHRLTPPIVHRDLKPANVLVERSADGTFVLRVTDFGIGAVAALPAIRAASQGTTTRGGLLATALRGAHTPLYASPQQMRGDDPDPRDDVHALGVIWYQLLAGDLSSGPPTGLWADELQEAGLSPGLIRLLGACVAARPEKRPADAAVLAEQLTALLAPPATPARPALVDAPPDPNREWLRQVESSPSWLLDLTGKQIGDSGAIALAASPHLAPLSTLILSSNRIGDLGAQALADSPYLANLNRLVLWENQIGDAGAIALAESPHLRNLTTLDIGSNRVGDAGAIALANSPNLPHLAALILVSNRIGDAGALALANSPYLANLAELKPLLNQITATGVAALRDRFGKRVRIY